MVDSNAELPRGGGHGAVAALVFASLVAGLMQTIVLQIQAEFPTLLNAPREETAWIVTATLVSACAFAPVVGRLGDMVGRTRIAIALMGILAAGSMVSALAPNVWVIIAGRVLQGLAIGVIPLSIAIMHDVVSSARLGGAIAMAAGTLGIGSAFGLPLGALIAETLGWRAIFLACFALSLAGGVWIWIAVPRAQPRSAGGFDVVGAAGLAAGVTALLVGLSQALVWGWSSPATIAMLGAGIVVLLITVIHLARHPSPIIDVRVSGMPSVLFTNVVALLLNFAMMGSTIAFPQLLSLPTSTPSGLGLGPVVSGVIMMATGVATAAATPLIARLSTRHGPKRLLVGGALIIGVGLAVAASGRWSGWLFLVLNVVLGVGFGMAFAAMPQIIMKAVPGRDIAAANGLNAQIRFFGTASAAALIAAVLARWSATSGFGAVPTSEGFRLALLLCAAAGFAGAGISVAIPPDRRKGTGVGAP